MKLKSILASAALSVVAALAVSGAASANTQINTVQSFTGDWTPFGEPDTSTYGQTFTVGADNVLKSFSMYLDGGTSSPLPFKAYVYQWNGTNAVGSALYASALQSFTGTAWGSPEQFTFDTGALKLTNGQQYVAFLSSAGIQDGNSATAGMPVAGDTSSNPYAGGQFVYFNTGNDFSRLTTDSWDLNGRYNEGSVWFQAALTSGVPEPATWAMLILGLGMIGFAARRQRQAVALAA